MHYDLELGKAVEKIKQEKAQTVCIQLPDGLKPKAGEIQEYLQKTLGCTDDVPLQSVNAPIKRGLLFLIRERNKGRTEIPLAEIEAAAGNIMEMDANQISYHLSDLLSKDWNAETIAFMPNPRMTFETKKK